MRQTWNDVHFGLRAENQPTISRYKNVITLSLPGYLLDGQGFAIELTRAHLGMAQRLLAALEALPPLPSESNADPFADPVPCPTCPHTTTGAGILCDACTDVFAAQTER